MVADQRADAILVVRAGCQQLALVQQAAYFAPDLTSQLAFDGPIDDRAGAIGDLSRE